MELVNCEWCQIPIKKTREWHKFCSDKCRTTHNKSLTAHLCAFCGKEYHLGIFPQEGNCCSSTCFWELREKERLQKLVNSCVNCKKMFTPTTEDQMYCSTSCIEEIVTKKTTGIKFTVGLEDFVFSIPSRSIVAVVKKLVNSFSYYVDEDVDEIATPIQLEKTLRILQTNIHEIIDSLVSFYKVHGKITEMNKCVVRDQFIEILMRLS